MTVRIIHGDCRDILPTLPEASVQTCVTSPPYYGLRDYGQEAQIGRESSLAAYVAALVGVFREVRRVLRTDGTLWLNLGDSYGHGKQLLMMPARVALALQDDGWVLRSAIVWHNPGPMPESVKDRPTCSYELLFLLAVKERYFYDFLAVAEQFQNGGNGSSGTKAIPYSVGSGRNDTLGGNGKHGLGAPPAAGVRNVRDVWTIGTPKTGLGHFATMPPALAERCIKAGSRPGDMVLDPFGGAGTTGLVADRLGRDATLIELNPDYAGTASGRISDDAPLFADVI